MVKCQVVPLLHLLQDILRCVLRKVYLGQEDVKEVPRLVDIPCHPVLLDALAEHCSQLPDDLDPGIQAGNQGGNDAPPWKRVLQRKLGLERPVQLMGLEVSNYFEALSTQDYLIHSRLVLTYDGDDQYLLRSSISLWAFGSLKLNRCPATIVQRTLITGIPNT